jgi:hypothetical protein
MFIRKPPSDFYTSIRIENNIALGARGVYACLVGQVYISIILNLHTAGTKNSIAKA